MTNTGGNKMTQGEKIIVENGVLKTPNNHMIAVSERDGTGRVIWEEADRDLDTAGVKADGSEKEIVWREVSAREKAYLKFGEGSTDKTREGIREDIIAIEAPLTTPIC